MLVLLLYAMLLPHTALLFVYVFIVVVNMIFPFIVFMVSGFGYSSKWLSFTPLFLYHCL